MSNNQIPLINPISGKIISKSILDFSSLDTLIDYLYTQEPSFQRQLAVNTDLDHINSTDDPFCKTNILIIDQNGELLTTSLFFRLHNFKHAKFYAFNKSIFFGKNENSNIDDYLNHIVDPLPTLIKPVKPSSNSKVLLESWAVALELDVQSYFSIIERFHDTEYDIYKQGLRSIMKLLIVYCKGNVLAEDKITTDEVSNFSFDIHALKANFKNIEIDQTNSLIDIIDYDLFEQYYFKFKDLKQKINTFKQNIIIKDYEAILNALTKFEYFVNQLITKFDQSFDKNLDFDIDSLMFEKFSTLIEHKSGNLFTSQIDNLYTIANSLFVKSTEILIMKRNIQKEILSIDYNSILKKMVSLKKIIDSDFNENMNLLVHRYDTLKYIEFDLPLIYGMNLLESVRRKIIFKTKYYLKFSSLIVNNNDWLEEDLKIEYDIRNNYLSNLEELENISFLNKKVFSNKFQIKNTFSDLRKLQKYITLGEYDDNDADDEELDIETRNLLSYCDYLEHNNYESLAKELLVSFEDMKGELLNNSEIEQQMNKSKVESLENEVEELKAKLILQDLIETDDWPVEMSSLSIKQESPLVESVNNNYEENKTIKLLNEQLKTSTEKNVFMENKLNETVLMFKQDFNIASKMNSELIKENEDLKLMLSKSENDNRNLHDRMKNLLYKDISLLEKIG